MVTTLKDTDGKIIAFCEWRLVGRSGNEVPSGEYVWINDCWVHPSMRFAGKIGRIFHEVLESAPSAKYGYFQRKNVNDTIHIWTREQFKRRAKVYDLIGDK